MREKALRAWRSLPHPLRWISVAVAGGACILAGLVMLVLPGPGIPVLILGLVILASEFAWAQVVLERVRRHSRTAVSVVSNQFTRRFGKS